MCARGMCVFAVCVWYVCGIAGYVFSRSVCVLWSLCVLAVCVYVVGSVCARGLYVYGLSVFAVYVYFWSGVLFICRRFGDK